MCNISKDTFRKNEKENLGVWRTEVLENLQC